MASSRRECGPASHRSHQRPSLIRSVRRRQYVHRLSNTWNIKKYKKRTSPRSTPGSPAAAPPAPIQQPLPPNTTPAAAAAPLATTPATEPVPVDEPQSCYPDLSSADATRRHDWLAGALLALGDAYWSFVTNAALYEADRSASRVVDCVRTAQTPAQAGIACGMLADNSEALRGQDGEDSWVSFFFDLLRAHMRDAARDPDDGGIVELEELLPAKIITRLGQGGELLQPPLAPRGPRLDVPAYLVLGWALMRYNSQCADSSQGDQLLDARRILGQFLDQQPAFAGVRGPAPTDPLLGIECLLECLRWCAEVLEMAPGLAREVRGAVSDRHYTEVYAVLCTLWRALLATSLCPPGSPLEADIDGGSDLVSPANWADDAKWQLGISAAELLATVVCMIMAAAPQEQQQQQQQQEGMPLSTTSDPVLTRALVGARALELADSQDLIRRFLVQVLSANLPRMAGAAAPAGAAEAIQPFRAFVARSLGVDDRLPALEPDAVVYPLVPADPGRQLHDLSLAPLWE